MKIKIKKEEFDKFDLGTKCAIFEDSLTDEFFGGQGEINFYVPPGYDGMAGENLPETPPEIQEVEDKKFGELVERLSEKLFDKTEFIEVDSDYFVEED